MSAELSVAMSHIGVCVSSMEKALTFYREGLGMEIALERPNGFVIDNLINDLLALPGSPESVVFEAQFLTAPSANIWIELLEFRTPTAHSRQENPVVMNTFGLTQMCFRVSDVDAVAKRCVQAGGRLAAPDATITTRPGEANAIALRFVLDPDGTRIELVGPANS